MRREFRYGEMMNRLTVTLAVAVVLTACAVGPKVKNFVPAQKPSGVETSLKLDGGGSVTGELLAVEETALVILSGNNVTRVAYESIDSGTFPQTAIRIGGHQLPRADARERLRLLSRFPQGLTPTLLSSLLAAYRQANIAVLPQ